MSNFIFCDKLYDFTKPTKKINSIYYSTKKILDFNPIEKTFEPQKLEEELLRLKKRSLIFLVGDFFELPLLKRASKKHEIIAIVVRDKLEEYPVDFGEVCLLDPQTKEIFNSQLNQKLIKEYHLKIKEYDKKLFKIFKELNIRWSKIYTDDQIFLKLRKFLYE